MKIPPAISKSLLHCSLLLALPGLWVSIDPTEAADSAESADLFPRIRRNLVPADRPEIWPRGDWQPVLLTEFERQLAAAAKTRPGPVIETADYSATIRDDELSAGRLTWEVRRPDATAPFLQLGRPNLNIGQLRWSNGDSGEPGIPAVWGTNQVATSVVAVDRAFGRLTGDWNCTGRKLATSSEFDIELPQAALSRLKLRVPTGLVVSSSAGESIQSAVASEPGWSEWRLNLGSRTSCRLRITAPKDPSAARPLIVVRTSINYAIRAEAVRVQAEFDVDILESSKRELRLLVDPEIQVTAVQTGDGGVVSWKQSTSPLGQVLVVQLPESAGADAQTLEVRGICQARQFAPWTLPRILIHDAVEAAGKVTLRLFPPFQAADIRADGYRQIELTTTPAEGESLLFRQIRPGGSITVVPGDNKAEISCRAVTLLEPDRNQWALVSQLEWKATGGSAFSAACLIPNQWEIVDVRPGSRADGDDLSGWDVQPGDEGLRVLHLFFTESLRPDRRQRVRITAHRPAPTAIEQVAIPPLVPVDASEAEQFVVVASAIDSQPVIELGPDLASASLRDLPREIRQSDFLSAPLSDRRVHPIVLRSSTASAGGRLQIEPIPAAQISERGRQQEALLPGGQEPIDRAERSATADVTGVLISVKVAAHLSGLATGFDHYRTRLQSAAIVPGSPLQFTLPEPAELIGIAMDGRSVHPEINGRTYVVLPDMVHSGDSSGNHKASSLEIEYRVPAVLKHGPNFRGLLLPVPVGTVLKFELELVLPGQLRLGGQPRGVRFDGFGERDTWYRRLMGPFGRAENLPIFNPFEKSSWANWPGLADDRQISKAQVWRAKSPGLPPQIELQLWNGTEVNWFCAGLLAASAAGCIVLRLSAPNRWRQPATFGILALAIASLGLPQVSAELTASALTGLILSALLPRHLLEFVRPRDSAESAAAPTGSTQSFVPITGAVLCAGMLASSWTASAQEGAVPAAVGGATARSGSRRIVDILIPVDRAGNPAGTAPIVYVPGDWLAEIQNQIQSTRHPQYLIGACSYDGHVGPGDRLHVTARFQVHVFARQPVVRVDLPIGNVNLGGNEACQVDGQTHQILRGPDGRGLVLEVAGPGSSDPPGLTTDDRDVDIHRDTDSVAERESSLRVRTYEVELRIHPSTDPGRGDLSMASLIVPGGNQTQATIQSAVLLPVLGVAPAEPGRTSDHIRRIRTGNVAIRPGPVTCLVFYWSPAADAGVQPPSEIQAGVSCLADVSPALIQLRYHVAYHLDSGQIGSLVWRVPAGYVLQSVQASQLAGYRLRPESDDSRELLMEFSRPQIGDFSIAATFVMAVDQKSKEVTLPLLDPLRVSDGDRSRVSARFSQFALRQPSDVQVVVSPLADQVPRPRAIDDFLKEWNAAGARPSQAFDVEGISSLRLAIDGRQADPAVRGSAIARFHSNRLDWTYTAAVEQPLIPQFAYRLSIDPRLRIREVSVQESGAERLLRWSRSGESLTLFLSDAATRPQRVRIDASLPIATEQEIDLPRMRFATAIPGPERISLFRDADVAIHLVNADDFPLAEDFQVSNDLDQEILAARLEVLPDQATPRVRTMKAEARVTAAIATLLSRHSSSWQTTTGIQFQVTAGRAREFEVDLPESYAATITPTSPVAMRTTSRQSAEGRVTLTFRPDEPVTDRFVVVLAGETDMSQREWRIPTVQPSAADQLESCLIVPRGAVEPVLNSRPLETGTVPAWFQQLQPSTTTADQWTVFRWNPQNAEPVFRSTPTDPSPLPGARAHVDLWIDHDGSAQGWMRLELADQLPIQVELIWPESVRPLALFFDGQFRRFPPVENGRAVISIPSAMQDRRLWLAWSKRIGSLPVVTSPLALETPWPRDLVFEPCQISLHVPPDVVISELSPAVRQESLSRTVAQLPLISSPDRQTAEGSAAALLLAVPVPPPGDALDLSKSIRLSLARLPDWAVGIGGSILLLLILRKTGPAWRWLEAHDTAAWIILALLWWLVLTPSWLGPAVATWAIARAVSTRTRVQV